MTKIDLIADLTRLGPMARVLIDVWGYGAHEALLGELMVSRIAYEDEVHFFIRPMRGGYRFELVRV